MKTNSPKAWHDNIDVLPSITVDRGEGCAVNLGACNCGDSEKTKNGTYFIKRITMFTFKIIYSS